MAEFMAALDKDKNNHLEWKEFKEFLKVFYHREDKFRKFILALYEPQRLKWLCIHFIYKYYYTYLYFYIN